MRFNEGAERKRMSELIDGVLDCIEIDYKHPVITELGVAFTIDRQKSRENMAARGIIRTEDI